MNPTISLIFITLLLFIIIPNQATDPSVNSLQRRTPKLPRNIFGESQIHRRLLDDDEEDIDANDNDDGDDGSDTSTGNDIDDDLAEGTDDASDDNEQDDDNESQDDNNETENTNDIDASGEGALFKGVKHLEGEEKATRDHEYSQYNDGNYDVIMLLIGNIWCLLFLFIFANGIFFYFYHKERSKNNFIKTRTLIQQNINKNEFSSSEV